MPRRSRATRICRPYSSSSRAIDFEQLDVDDDLGPRLVDRLDDASRRGDALGRVLDRQRVGGGQRRDPARVDHDAEQVDRFLQVRVAQIESADDLFLVLAALGGVSGMIVIVRWAVTL